MFHICEVSKLSLNLECSSHTTLSLQQLCGLDLIENTMLTFLIEIKKKYLKAITILTFLILKGRKKITFVIMIRTIVGRKRNNLI